MDIKAGKGGRGRAGELGEEMRVVGWEGGEKGGLGSGVEREGGMGMWKGLGVVFLYAGGLSSLLLRSGSMFEHEESD